jgi:hypothetical protein
VAAIENLSRSAGQPPSPTPGDHLLHALRKDTDQYPDTPAAKTAAERLKAITPKAAKAPK